MKNFAEEDETWTERMEMDYFTDDLESMSKWIFENFGSHEKLPAALEVEGQMEFRTWLSLLGEIWCFCDNIGIYKDSLLEVFNDRLARPWETVPELMDAEERLAFEALPDQITIYRGCGSHNKHGFSWSLNREVAAEFPFKRRYRVDRPMLLTATINKNRAAALKLGRNEQEIIVLDLSSNSWTEQRLKDPSS
jgi:hypothetical protein